MPTLRLLAITVILSACSATSSGGPVAGLLAQPANNLASDSDGETSASPSSSTEGTAATSSDQKGPLDLQQIYSGHKEAATLAAAVAAEQAAQEKREREQRAGEDALIRADILLAMDALILEANEVAALEDGKIFIKQCSFDRVVYFYHRQGEEERVTETWTDEYTTAVSQTYRYSRPYVIEIQRDVSSPSPRATVQFSLDLTDRFAVAGESKEVPQPPADFGYGGPRQGGKFGGLLGLGGRRNLRAAHSGLKEDKLIPLGVVGTPVGKLYEEGAIISDHTGTAVLALEDADQLKERRTVKLDVEYSYSLGQWILRSTPSPQASPTRSLPWEHGLSQDALRIVYDPDESNRSQPIFNQ